MKITFISLTPLAGAPYRIAQALTKYTEFNCRLINLNPNIYGTRTFPEDLLWKENREECIEQIQQSDILQFFHFIDFDSANNPFNLCFRKLAKTRCKFVRMFESELNFVANNNPTMIDKIINDPYPKLVIPHYPERTFLDAYVVPNILPLYDEILLPYTQDNNSTLNVFYSASSPYSMWHTRWNTKGLPEVVEKFQQLRKQVEFNFRLIQNTPYEECQRIKQQSEIVIGDTTSGSFHLTDFEALSQGKPTFTYLDSRSQMILQSLLGCSELPFINSRLEEIDLPFIEIVKNKALREEIGTFSRNWIEKYYNEKDLVKFYVEAYTKLLNNEPLTRQNHLEFPSAKKFLYNDLFDMQWETRKKSYTKRTKESHMEYIMATQAENDVLKPILDKIEGFSEMPLTEKEFLNTLILRHKPKKILELGVSAGGSAAIILNAIKDDDEAFLYSVDYNTQWYKDASFESGFIVKEKLPNLVNKWKLFTPGLAANHIEQIGGDIDFCLIDTVHSNPGEILDFLMVLPYLKKDAIVVFHDISLQMWQETWASGMYTNCMLMSSIIGNKFLPSSSEHDTINIGAIQLNDYSTKNAFDIFNLLFIPWAYQINDRDHIVLITHFRKFYSTDLIEFYKKARTFYNKRLEVLPVSIFTNQENSTQSVKIIPLITKIKTDEGKKIKLFGKITIFKVRKSPNKTSKYLFGIKYYEKKVS